MSRPPSRIWLARAHGLRRKHQLSCSGLLLLKEILHFEERHGRAFPSHDVLAQRLGLCRHTVIRQLAVARRLGLLAWRAVFVHGRRISNLYQRVLPAENVTLEVQESKQEEIPPVRTAPAPPISPQQAAHSSRRRGFGGLQAALDSLGAAIRNRDGDDTAC